MLTANILNHTLMVGGAAAVTDDLSPVSISRDFYAIEVHDNDPWYSMITVTGDPINTVDTIDARQITGAGVTIYAYTSDPLTIFGTMQDDFISSSFDAAAVIYGYKGDDWLIGGALADLINGGTGVDTIDAGGGDDTIIGGRGNDLLNGGAGIDTLILSGARADYVLSVVNGDYMLSHLGGAGADGDDLVTNIERLQFTDQTQVIAASPTNLTANISNHTLVIGGAAARSEAWSSVSVYHDSSSLQVRDNNYRSSLVDLTGQTGTSVHTIDARQMTGAGVSLYSYEAGPITIYGSMQDDSISTGNDARATVYGYKGDDRLTGGDRNDTFDGGSGNDTIDGGGGNDIIEGGRGDDFVDGGEGTDTLVLTGVQADYVLSIVSGEYVISHLGGNGADGTDSFTGIEKLRFSDATIEIAPAPTNVLADISGGELVISGTAARSNVWQNVNVLLDTVSVEATDNNFKETVVQVTGAAAGTVHTFDARQLGDGGVSVDATMSLANRFLGSMQDDYIFASETEQNEITGYKGNDWLQGGNNADQIDAGTGDDTVYAGGGNDTIEGGRGIDYVNGGSGVDTMILNSVLAEYDLSLVNGNYNLSHLNGAGADGIDILKSVEFLEFTDQTIAIDDFPLT